jgi:hypothetical protein
MPDQISAALSLPAIYIICREENDAVRWSVLTCHSFILMNAGSEYGIKGNDLKRSHNIKILIFIFFGGLFILSIAMLVLK